MNRLPECIPRPTAYSDVTAFGALAKEAPVPWFSSAPDNIVKRQGQELRARTGSQTASISLPNPETPVMAGVVWGRPDTLFTPAYWRAQVWFTGLSCQTIDGHSLGDTLMEEVAACLLGGYGIPAEVGLAAYERCRERGLLTGKPPSTEDCYRTLAEPLWLSGHQVHYRFARQKADYLSATLHALAAGIPATDSDTSFRNWLATLPGIGLKTASWITRNWLDSDSIAIIDVHVHRAGLLAGFFLLRHKLPDDYLEMERQFLLFAHRIGVRPSALDAVIWRDMRRSGAVARDMVNRLQI